MLVGLAARKKCEQFRCKRRKNSKRITENRVPDSIRMSNYQPLLATNMASILTFCGFWSPRF